MTSIEKLAEEATAREGIEWAIIYSDYSIITNLDSTWEEAEPFGVAAIVYRTIETGWSISVGGDYYFWDENGELVGIKGHDALVDYVTNVWKKVKVGRMVGMKEWGQLNGLAIEIMRGVKKTAYFKNERRSE